eukprot:NODE_6995_length_821_cov_15.810888_g6394_i0.p1 GENE.NODE_6995_length_821_cov_15.810888_g6394_i0~~NODE_6995_length_821_cov_15.810888_g6394_i0.p1  ORF type:complete len:212 (+),score=34.74 NODE_6995_length_821_cov_15.810888_g6394_i0:80-715(+)
MDSLCSLLCLIATARVANSCIERHRVIDRDEEHELGPKIINVACSLNELYTGCQKTITISRQVVDQQGGWTKEVDHVVPINIKPGWRAGTKLTYSKMGDEHPGRVTTDLILVLFEEEHDYFVRRGDDLLYNHQVTLADALSGFEVTITTLDNRQLVIPINEVVDTNYIKVVKGEGMPKKWGWGHGDLKISFEVVFPTGPIRSKEEVKVLWD